jgi:hypothetical protein
LKPLNDIFPFVGYLPEVMLLEDTWRPWLTHMCSPTIQDLIPGLLSGWVDG